MLIPSVALCGVLAVQQPPAVDHFRPPAPPVPDTVIQLVTLMRRRGDSLAAVYPSLWERGQRFVISTDRSQLVLAGPDPHAFRFVPATDSAGRPVLPGSLWVAPTSLHPWDTAGGEAIAAARRGLPWTSFGDAQRSFEEPPGPRDVPELVASLLRATSRLRLPAGARSAGAHQERPSSIHAPWGDGASDTALTLERDLFLRALATRGAERERQLRDALALRWIRIANHGVSWSGPDSPTRAAARERAVYNGTGIVLGRDSAAYDSLLQRRSPPRGDDPGWSDPPDQVRDAAIDLRILDRLGIDWRPDVAAGITADSLLRVAARFDPVRGIVDAERLLRPIGLGREVVTGGADDLARAFLHARGEGVRTDLYGAWLQRVVGDTMPLAIDVPAPWLADSTRARLRVDAGSGGSLSLGTAGNTVYLRAARVRLTTPELMVDLTDVPAVVEHGSGMRPDMVRLLLFLPDSVLARRPEFAQEHTEGIGDFTIATPNGQIRVTSPQRLFRTSCCYILRSTGE